MIINKHYEDATDEEQIQSEMQEEIDSISIWIKKYVYNIESLYGKDLSKEVKKSMINQLIETM